MTHDARWLGAALLAGVLLTAVLAYGLRPRAEHAARLSFGSAAAPRSEEHAHLSPVAERGAVPRTAATRSTPADPVPFADSSRAAVRALAASLRDVGFERRAFEAEARARVASLPDGAIQRLQREPPPDECAEEWVARAVLVRLADLPDAMRRDLLHDDVARLRSCLDDESLPLGMVAQAGAALVAAGNVHDRERLVAQLDGPLERSRAVARIALECLEGPGAGALLVDEVTAELARGGDVPALPLVAQWMSTRATTLPVAERLHCAAALASAMDGAKLDAEVRARALTALCALDPQRAVSAAQEWLQDPRAEEALVLGACSALRAGRVDEAAAIALVADPRLDAARRIAIAEACFGAARGATGERDRDGAALMAVRDLAGPSNHAQIRARACFLLVSSSPSALRGLEAWTTADPDPLVRAASDRALRIHAAQPVRPDRAGDTSPDGR